jgi:UDP-N-acetylglucosamine 3-dehydrogenase
MEADMAAGGEVLRWGVLGFGAFSDAAMGPAIASTPGHLLAAIQGRNPERTSAFAQKYNVPFFTQDPKAVLSQKRADAVYIAAPNNLHAAFTVMAAEAGLHVLCEKPMARNLAEAQQMASACRKNNVKLMIGHMMRFNPCHYWAKDFLKSGGLGKVIEARGKFGFHLPTAYPLSTSPWHLDPEDAGGGSLLSVGIHVVDLLRFILGQEVRQVTSLMETRTYRFPMDWESSTVLRFEGGAIATVLSSFENLCGPNDLEICGTDGLMRISGTLWRESTGQVEVEARAGKQTYQPPADTPNPYVLQIEHFADCIHENTEPLIGGEEGVKAIAACMAAYESARTGKAVSL